MKMHQSISQLTGIEQKELSVIAEGLRVFLGAEVIFCYGSRIARQTNRSCFTPKRRVEDASTDYDLVVIVNDNNPSDEDSLRKTAGWLTTRNSGVHIIVHKASFVKEEMDKGNFFFTWLYRSAIILYDKHNSWLHYKDRLSRPDCIKLHERIQETIGSLLQKAESCILTASDQMGDNSQALALALDSQALVYACKAAIMGCLGYETTTGDPEYLINCTLNFTDAINGIFPRDTEEEEELFYLLLTSTGLYLKGENDRIPEARIVKIIHQRVRHAYEACRTAIYQSHFIEPANN